MSNQHSDDDRQQLDRSQLRVIETEQQQGPEQKFIRYGVPGIRASLQPETDRQLTLSEAEPEEGGTVKIYGLKLSYSEHRALNAVMLLLAQRGYRGDATQALTPSQVDTIDRNYGYRGPLPVLLLDGWSPYLEAYGVGRGSSGRFNRNQQNEAEEALFSLGETRNLLLQWPLNNKTYSSNGPERLLIPRRVYGSGMTEEEADEQRLNGRNPRMSGLNIFILPMMMVGLHSGSEFFTLLPADLFQQINDLFDKRFISDAVPLFIKYLVTWDKDFRESRKKLANKLYLDYYVRERKPTLLQERLDECFYAALELGFLKEKPTVEQLSPSSDPVFQFRLAPEMCSRLRVSLERQEARQRAQQAATA